MERPMSLRRSTTIYTRISLCLGAPCWSEEPVRSEDKSFICIIGTGFSLEEAGTHLNISVPKIKKVRRQLHQFVYRVLLRFDMEDPDVLENIEEEWPLSRIETIIRYLALIPSTTQIDCDILLSPEGAALQDCPRLFHAYTLLKRGCCPQMILVFPRPFLSFTKICLFLPFNSIQKEESIRRWSRERSKILLCLFAAVYG